VPKITFQPADVTIEVNPGTTVFGAAAMAGVAIPSQCGGKCACALCRVTVLSGEDLISPMGWEEEGHMGNVFYLTRERLSCQLRVFGDVVVQIAEEPEKHKKARGRYIPYALVRKRETMEREEELRRVRGDARPAEVEPRRRTGPDRERSPSPKRKRNRGGVRVGDHRPPPGAKKDGK
jgi:ferredoxin